MRTPRPKVFWTKTRIIFYSAVVVIVVAIALTTFAYAFVLQAIEAEAYCSYNNNVIDGLALSPESCVHWYKKTNRVFGLL